MEERCRRIGARLHDDALTGYELVDLETSLWLIDGALARYVRDSVDRYGGSETLCAARAAHNRMHDRLDLVSRYREELLVGELRGFLYEAQGYAMETLLVLGTVSKGKLALMRSQCGVEPGSTRPSAPYMASDVRMAIGRTRK